VVDAMRRDPAALEFFRERGLARPCQSGRRDPERSDE
jgi:hypothetical protein